MDWLVALVAGLIGALCGARLTIGGAVPVFAGVLLAVLGLNVATGVDVWPSVIQTVLSAITLQLGYLLGAFGLARQSLPAWSFRRHLNKPDKSDPTP